VAQQPHAYWQHQFLHTAGLPAGTRNVIFLTDWDRSVPGNACDYNVLQLSHREPGATRCRRLPNGDYQRSYTDTQSAADAFAAQINSGNYPDLRKALVSGNPYGYDDTAGVAADLQEWGAHYFREFYVQFEGGKGPFAGPAGGPTSRNVGAAWSHLMKTFAVDGHRTIVELHKVTGELNRIERRLRRA
jgi:hypothetical protein